MQAAIRNAIDAFGRATLVVHSTGGLVFRAFIEANPSYAAKIDQVIAFAVPWAGTLDAFEALTHGVSERFLGVIGFDAHEVQQMTSTCQAAYDLCPPDPAETDMSGVAMFLKNGVVVGPLVAPQDWTGDAAMQALAQNARARLGVRSRNIANALPIVNICGWGASTIDSCTLANGQLTFHIEKSGDGTVPLVSSSWLNVPKTFFVPVGAYERNAIPQAHPHIWDSPPVLPLLDSLIGTRQPGPFIAAAVDSDDNFPSVDPVRIRIAASDSDGAELPDASVLLLGQTFAISRRLEIKLPRAGLPNNANGFARLEVQVRWNGGSAKTAVAIRVA